MHVAVCLLAASMKAAAAASAAAAAAAASFVVGDVLCPSISIGISTPNDPNGP